MSFETLSGQFQLDTQSTLYTQALIPYLVEVEHVGHMADIVFVNCGAVAVFEVASNLVSCK